MNSTPSSDSLRDHFLDWQCRLRRRAMRREGGCPSPGMRPRVSRPDGSEIAPAITVLLTEKEPAATIDLLRHIVRKTHDARRRYQDGLRFLASAYYQDPRSFSDVLTGLFAADSAVAAALIAEGRCVLHFREDAEGYRVPCVIGELAEGDAAFQATYWHNRLFGPDQPTGVRLLAFRPDWERASAVAPS